MDKNTPITLDDGVDYKVDLDPQILAREWKTLGELLGDSSLLNLDRPLTKFLLKTCLFY